MATLVVMTFSSVFAFSARAIVRHFLTALWIFLLGALGVEWLLPGAVTSRLPIMPITFAGALLTLIVGPMLARRTSRLGAVLGLVFSLGGGVGASALFALREPSSLVRIASFLVALIAVGLCCAALLPEELEQAG